MTFTIGTVQGLRGYETAVVIGDDGVSLYERNGGFNSGFTGPFTPAQTRDLGQLLINAADRWTELQATVKQSQAQVKAAQKTAEDKVKDLLS